MTKIRPYIRAQRSSQLAMLVATDLNASMKEHKALFKFRPPSIPPVSLILDRRDDSVTPLLTQWTYQAMVHEFIGINNDLVQIASSNAENSQATQIVLSPHQDPFYRENMYKNFGDLGIAIKGLVDAYQTKQKLNKDVKSIEDMKRFVTEYPEFKKLSGNVSKHVTLMEQLQQQISKRCLLDVSEVEQFLACHEDYEDATKKLEGCFNNQNFDPKDLLRLVLLYALRYEKQKDFQQNSAKFIKLLISRGVPEEDTKLVTTILRYGGYQKRSEHLDIFDNKDIITLIRKSIDKGLTGVTNIYTQHKPVLYRTINDLVRNKLPETGFPFLEGALTKERPQQILIFMIGGITYEESFCVFELNNTQPSNSPSQTPFKILLGGTSIHNSRSFIQGLKDFANQTSTDV